jgi:GLPGLI family protein
MKHTLLLLAGLCIAAHTDAQITNGKVTYEEAFTVNVPPDAPGDAAVIKGVLGQGFHFNHVLSFNQEATVYRPEKKEQKNISSSNDDGMAMQIHIKVPEDITYTDLKTGAMLEQRDLMGRKFLVSGDASRRKWQMTGKQKTILTYPCQEAISYGVDTVQAWFTTAIPVSGGPQDWRGLPGMILEGSRLSQNGTLNVKATQVEEGAVSIEAPTEGKKVTKEEFEKIQKEKMKEMQEQFGGHGGSGGHLIIMSR